MSDLSDEENFIEYDDYEESDTADNQKGPVFPLNFPLKLLLKLQKIVKIIGSFYEFNF